MPNRRRSFRRLAPLAVPLLLLTGAGAEPLTTEQILKAPDPATLSQFHATLATEPHVAGSPGDLRTIERLAGLFDSFGLHVETHEFFTYIPRPIDASLAIVTPEPKELAVREPVIEQAPATAHPELNPLGWNAYSGSGEVTGQVVYANYGTMDDFAQLRAMGVSCKGKIVLAKYGGNFRGYKAKYAEEAGAAGLIIFTDPEDNGYGRGAMYPEGGYSNPEQIQRGSIKALAYDGDPLTPFSEASESAERLDPATVGLPTIPVQPIGWASAEPILKQMDANGGEAAPEDWQGGLPLTYRISGGEGLTLRLMVEQEREIVRSANVIATLEGIEQPKRKVIIGSHHDAWGIGAGDPLAGTIVTIETARALSELVEQGWRPKRSIVFACWGAEEYGIIGSVEWCEANAPDLLANAIAYINLDAAAMGPNFATSASPSLHPLIRELAGIVPDTEGAPIHSEGQEPMRIGRLGGGSDHSAFLTHLCIPSVNLGAYGSAGSSYHSNYDTLEWYHQIVGSDYESALMLARMSTMLAVRLTSDTIIPLNQTGLAADATDALDTIAERASKLGFSANLKPLRAGIDAFAIKAQDVADKLESRFAQGDLDAQSIEMINSVSSALDRAWMSAEGLPGRPWRRNLYAAPDETSGYAAWGFPGVRHALEARDRDLLEQEQQRCLRSLDVMTQMLDALDAMLD